MSSEIKKTFLNYEPVSKIVIISLLLTVIFGVISFIAEIVPDVSTLFVIVAAAMFFVYIMIMVKTAAIRQSIPAETADAQDIDGSEYDVPVLADEEDSRMIVLYSFVAVMFLALIVNIMDFVYDLYIYDIFSIFAFFVMSACTMIIGLEMFRSVRDFGR